MSHRALWTGVLVLTATALLLAAPSTAGLEALGGSAAVRPAPGVVVDAFDPPEEPWHPGNRGVKLAAEPGDEVRAALDGSVTFAGQVAGAGWVTVDHGGGLDTTYGEVDPGVVVGRRVRAGETIARLSDEQDRLHWGARVGGDYIDPLWLLGRWHPRLVPVAR